MGIRHLIMVATTTMAFGGTGEAMAGPVIVPVGPYGPLVELSVRRVLLADLVAAAKFGTTQPIDDPVREQQILAAVAAESVRLGMPPEPGVRLFRAQIEASKLVQRGLFERWLEHPDERPADKPDLARQVRPQLDRLTTQLLNELRVTLEVRRPSTVSGVWRIAAKKSAGMVHRLDRLHRDAVALSLRPIGQA